MGNFFSRLKNKSASNSKGSQINKEVLDDKTKNNLNTMNTVKLKEDNNFPLFENVLNVNCALNTTCIFGLNDYSLQLFDYQKNKKIKNWKGHEKDIIKAIYCSKIDRYVSCSRDKSIKLWNINSDKCELNMNFHSLVVTAITADPENNYIISGSRDNTMALWDLKTGNLISNANISRNLITDAYWSLDRKLLIQSSEDKEVRIWDPINLKVIHSFPKKQYIQSSCYITSDNNYGISTSNGFQGNGCEITVWDLRKRCILKELFGHEQTVTCAKAIHSDKFIASCSNDSTVRLWDFKTLENFDTIYLSNTLTSLAESAHKNLIISSLTNGIYYLTV